MQEFQNKEEYEAWKADLQRKMAQEGPQTEAPPEAPSKFTYRRKITLGVVAAVIIFFGIIIHNVSEVKKNESEAAKNRQHLEEAKKAINAGRLGEAKDHLVAMNKNSQEWNSEGKILWDKIGTFITEERKAAEKKSDAETMRRVADDLSGNLGKSNCITSWQFDESAFKIHFNPYSCKAGELSAAIVTVRYIFESNNAKFPETIVIDYGLSRVESYPFTNIPSLSK